MHIFPEHGLLRPVLTTITSNHPEFRSGPQPKQCKQLWWHYLLFLQKKVQNFIFPCLTSANSIFSIFFSKNKKMQKTFFACFPSAKIFFHFLFFLKKNAKRYFSMFSFCKKMFSIFYFFLKIKKCKNSFFPKLHDEVDAISSFFAEFHQVCYLQLTEMHVANSMKFSKK